MAGKTGGSADLRIVLLGKTGVGKSSVGNTILGVNLFETSCYGNSDTVKCEAKTETVDGRSITVIDTPGYFATDEELKPEIAKCIIECSPGPHAFIIVLTVGTSPEEMKVVEEILKMFGEEALKYAVVLFTHGDTLDDNVTIQEFVDKNSHLKTLVQKCGNRCLVMDNQYWNNPISGSDNETRNAKEIQKLVNIIDQMVERNGGKHYTNEMLQVVAQQSKRKAKEKRFLIQAAAVTTGVLMGALLGPFACVRAFSRLFPKASTSARIGLGVAAGVLALPLVPVGVFGGAIAGGITGAKAANEAATAREAAERAVEAVAEQAGNVLRAEGNTGDLSTHPHPN